jgi:uncharacterized protein (TIGR00369 family)
VNALSADELQNLLDQSFPDGVTPRVREVTADGIVLTHDLDERHGRPGGTLSGPAMMTLADTAAWLATMAAVGPALLAVTTSLHIDFLRKPALAGLEARARRLKTGRRLCVVDVELFSMADRSLVAKAQVTYSLPPASA